MTFDTQEETELETEEVEFEEETEDTEQEDRQDKMIPLSALQKERQKRKELELNIAWQQQQIDRLQKPVSQEADDDSEYESVTRGQLKAAQAEAVRSVEEKLWKKENPERFEEVEEKLEQFLKQRPNLAAAINSATNRYEEAWTLMNALTPKQRQNLNTEVKKVAPNSPSGVPKNASINAAVDLMSLSDEEFHTWRKEQKRKARG